MDSLPEIINEYPPNWANISLSLDIKDTEPVFAYKGKIYNPFKLTLPEDVIKHEMVHFEQQGNNSDGWWFEYCVNKDFRKGQEAEAYAHQYLFVREHIPKASKECLEELAENLSGPCYNLGITKAQARTLIRRKSQNILYEKIHRATGQNQ